MTRRSRIPARVPLDWPPHPRFFPADVSPSPAESARGDGLTPATMEDEHGGGGGGDAAEGVVPAAGVRTCPDVHASYGRASSQRPVGPASRGDHLARPPGTRPSSFASPSQSAFLETLRYGQHHKFDVFLNLFFI